jgi:hypothetical protein
MGDERQYFPSAAKSGPQGLPDERQAREVKQSADFWAMAVRESPLNRLRYYDALIARPGFLDEPGQREKIKNRVGELIRELDAAAVVGDPNLASMVRFLFGAKGYERLKDRAKTAQLQQPDVVANMASPVHQRGER